MGRGIALAYRQAIHFLLPPACFGCGSPLSPKESQVCPGCRTRLRAPSFPQCPRCRAPWGTGIPSARPCPECREWSEALEDARSAYVLVPPADRLVYALKYGGWPEIAGFMADRMVPLLNPGERAAPWVIVPVPTTPSRERARGYNQAALLARSLAERTGLKLANILERREGGGTQVALHRHERRANVQGAFRSADGARNRLMGRSVLLVDDVLTTGSTGQAAAEALVEEAGAKRVRLITFARSLPQEEEEGR